MKLNATQSAQVEKSLGASALSDEHTVIPQLKEVFGDHTFFLDAGGLNIVEPHPAEENPHCCVVKLASWTDDRSALEGHEPQILPVTVELESSD